MNNRIITASKDKLPDILKQSNTTLKRCVVELDGRLIKTSDDYYAFVEAALSFPRPCEMVVDRYLDWMRDLSWLDYDSFFFVICNSTEFLRDDIPGRDKIFSDFENVIFPWWEKDVETCCVGGKAKEFVVLLV